MAKDPGKTLQDARNFRLGETNQTARESLNLQDRVDVWKINNKSRGSFNLALKGISKRANIDVALLNGTGQVIVASRNRSNKAEQLTNVPLETGTFYVQVKLRGSAESKYALTLSAIPAAEQVGNTFAIGTQPTGNSITSVIPAADQIGNTFETATLITGKPIIDFVGNADPNDFMKINPLVAGQFKLDLTGLSDDANIEIYDQNRTLLSTSINSGTTSETLQQSLTSIAGSTYFVRVVAAPGKETNYTLNYAFTPEKFITPSKSGLQYIDLAEGTGATPQTGQTVTVQYTGILTNGTKFDSSRDRNQPFSFRIGVGQVIKGWDEGISTMKVGGRRQLIIPPALGYGAQGTSGIPPNALLIFDVEVLGIS
jgi:FKBP-type peptidyl-prolyl cis-trans isomerase